MMFDFVKSLEIEKWKVTFTFRVSFRIPKNLSLEIKWGAE
jgi:hypothetical protein